MARYTGPTWKISRRLGISLSGTGKELAKRPYAPGQHGPTQRKKLSEYGIQLQEKQKLRHMYGLNERQFRRLFDDAGKMPGVIGENFMILLESRLDNLVYRLGFGRTRRAARQLVNHGHITVNGKKVDIPSYRVKVGDVIGLREKSRNLDVVKDALESRNHLPEYLSLDENSLEGTYTRLPERSELPAEITESLIVEFYSR
ncbi:30S ribosomal protein S4 [Caldalkalibacillus salinus]|uniref:30S ribosomal protein S4 n=1 Tax=Caldalkalibacillus salinus TaxID=2803787 RepID=UPI001923CFEB|nr:30S ribosomal protein S4 [Caldalkalibacillus salinus]